MWRALGEPDKTLVVFNGDAVMNLDLAHHLQAHRASGRRATLVVRPRAADQPGRVWLDAAGRLRGLRDVRYPRAGASLVEHDFTGVHLIEPSLLREIPLENGCMVGDVYAPLLAAGEEINVSLMEGFWAALDSPRLFLDTTRRVLAEPGLFEQAPLPTAPMDGIFVCSPEEVDERAKLAAPLFLGLYARVEAGAALGPNVVVDGCEIAPGARLENAVLYGMGRIEGDWRDCIAVAGKVAQLPT